jgi:hypothetical protein
MKILNTNLVLLVLAILCFFGLHEFNPRSGWITCRARRYSKQELYEKLVNAGFSFERSTSFVSMLLFKMLLSCLKKKHINADLDPTIELRLPKALNRLLLSIMLVEQKLIHIGVNFQVGGSRLIVARKI